MNTIQESHNFVWSTEKVLGKGATAAVYEGMRKSNGKPIAVKCFFTQIDGQFREFGILQKLQHENIVKLITMERNLTNKMPIIVMELCKGGSLLESILQPKNSYGLEESEFLLVLKHLSAGIKYLKDNNIVHRDLKPGNIMRCIQEDGKIIYKVADFGFARELKDDETFESLCGTEQYLNPNIYKCAVLRQPHPRKFNSSVDLWSIGVTLYQSATGELPFRAYAGTSRDGQEMFHLITTQKESGVISGVQTREDGPVEWSKELPKTCLLSHGLKKMLTPLLGGLLEANEKKLWSFDRFFSEVDHILSYQLVHIFYANEGKLYKLYLLPDQKYMDLQQSITNDIKIECYKQIVLHKNDLLINHINNCTQICEYPKTSTENPFFLFNKTYVDFRPLQVQIPEWIDFPSDISGTKDALPAKCASNIGYYCKTHIDKYSTDCKLITDSVEQFNEYIKKLVKVLQVKAQYFIEKMCVYKHPTKTLKVTKQISNTTPSKDYYEFLSSLIEEFLNTTVTRMRTVHDDQCLNNNLKLTWDDTIKNADCPYKNRASEKAKTHVDELTKSLKYFMETPYNVSISYSTGQWHILERKKVRQTLQQVTSLLITDTVPQHQQFLKGFQAWYQSAQKVYYEINILESEIERFEGILRDFQRDLSSEFTNFDKKQDQIPKKNSNIENLTLHDHLTNYFNNNDNFNDIYLENTRLINDVQILIKNIKL